MNETTVEQETHMDAFNSGCDLVLTHVEAFIQNLEASEDDDAMRYDKVKRMIAGMRVIVNRKRNPEPSIIVPSQDIIA